MVAVCRSEGLGDDLIEDFQPLEILAGELERPGGFVLVLGVFPKDAGAALGTDDRIVGILEHGDMIADPEESVRLQGYGEMTLRTAIASHQ